MTKEAARKVTDEIFLLYERFGSEDYIGEPISQVEHMCQAAALAEEEGYGEDVILAAFFHDIGHLCEFVIPVAKMGGAGVADHEKIGSGFLRERGFPEAVCRLIGSHVEAKRYLTARYPEYYHSLSEGSRITLEHQGGKMSEEEAVLFEKDPLNQLAIKLREWDDMAKEEGQPLPSLDKYREMCFRYLSTQ